MRVNYSFSLDNDQDRDILRWLNGLPKRERSKTIRQALRAHLAHSSVTLGDVYQAVKELERKLQNGVLVARNLAAPDDAPDEPPDVAANLDSLGL